MLLRPPSHQPTTLPRKLSIKSPTTASLLLLFYTSITTPCYSLYLLLFYLHYYTMSTVFYCSCSPTSTTPCSSLFFCYCSTSTTTPCYSLSLPFFSIIYPHSTRNYPATTLPVFLFHILHHCFRAHCVKPVLTSDGKRPPPLHPPTPFFLSHFTSPLGFKSNLSMSRINIRIETLVTKAKALRGEVYIATYPSLLVST